MSFNVCPAFYKFKIHPFKWLFEQTENRVNGLNDDLTSLVTEEFSDNMSDFSSGSRTMTGAQSKTGTRKTLTRQASSFYD